MRPLEIDCFSLEELAESRFKLEKDPFDVEFGSLVVSTSSFNGSDTSVISEAEGSGTSVSSCIPELNASSLSSCRTGLARPSTGISSIYSRPRLSWEYWKRGQKQ